MRSFVSYGEFTKRQSLYIVPLCLRTHVIVTGEQCKVTTSCCAKGSLRFEEVQGSEMSAQGDTAPPTECWIHVQVGLALEFMTLVTQREHTSLGLQKYFSAKGGNEAEW